MNRIDENRRLQDEFCGLDADPNATAEAWEILAIKYFEAGYPLNAGTCFMRADAIRDNPPRRPVGRPRKRGTIEIIHAEAV